MSVRTGAVFSVRPGQAPQHHARMLCQGAGEAGAREELLRVAVVPRRRPGHNLLERDSELVGAERPPLPDLLAKLDDLVPGPHAHRSHQGLDNLVAASAPRLREADPDQMPPHHHDRRLLQNARMVLE